MLAFSLLLDETNQNAVNYYMWIESTLQIYEKTPENVMFLVSDNTNTIPAPANQVSSPFIGCSSHRLALFVKLFLGIDPNDDAENPAFQRR